MLSKSKNKKDIKSQTLLYPGLSAQRNPSKSKGSQVELKIIKVNKMSPEHNDAIANAQSDVVDTYQCANQHPN